MSRFLSLRALVLGQRILEPVQDNIYSQLSASGVPVASADCRTCPNPCEEGHSEYPSRFSIDTDSEMLGSVKPFRRQILISTGKSDWDRDVTDTHGSLAAYISQTKPPRVPDAQAPAISVDLDEKAVPPVPGVFVSADATRLSILNGNHKTLSADETETVLVFPDYTMLVGVPPSIDGARELWKSALDTTLPRMGSTPKNKLLPNLDIAVFLRSHKRRDNRCAIAAPKLEHAFIKCLESRGWTADTQPEHIVEPPLEQFEGTAAEREEHIMQELRALPAAKKVLILRNSHSGGHRYAGNCIIYTPAGSSVWYGRVTTHEVESIVVNTIFNGLILGPLLRGGANLCRPGCPTLHDW
ncbi:Sucrase/ferredoxin-like-domain-containing protein [Mycena rebaudengoi]|nr:Sucrase/ferredoxin-like-domain-containing protein [Mycena rebaudengoi]